MGRKLWGFAGALAALAALAGPAALLAASAAVLMLGVHLAAEPVAHLARAAFDFVDTGVDALGAALLEAWGHLWRWSPARTEAVVDRFVGLVDVPEKLAAVHGLGLLLEAGLWLAWVPLAWHAQPWTPRLGRRPDMALRAWWKSQPRWVQVERAILLPMLAASVYVAAGALRLRCVAVAAGLGLTDSGTLGTLGHVAWVVAVALLTWQTVLPLLASSPQAAVRSRPARRIACLCTAPLLVVAAVEAMLW